MDENETDNESTSSNGDTIDDEMKTEVSTIQPLTFLFSERNEQTIAFNNTFHGLLKKIEEASYSKDNYRSRICQLIPLYNELIKTVKQSNADGLIDNLS